MAGAGLAATAVRAAGKTHKTAVCLIPPRRVWEAIQDVRVWHDKSFTRWPPHVNLLYPFCEAERFEEAIEVCRKALSSTKSFQVRG
jgi:hypothetical protein